MTTNSKYGIVYIDSSQTKSIVINSLFPEFSYTLFAYIEDRGGNIATRPHILTYRTSEKDRAIIIGLTFNQVILNEAEISIVSSAVAFTLSIPEINVQKRIYNHNTPNSRRERVLSNTYLLELYLVPLNSLSHWPSMETTAQLLNSDSKKKDWIQSKMPTFDKNVAITIEKFDKYEPSYIFAPESLRQAHDSLTFRVG